MLKDKPLVWILDDEWNDHTMEKEMYQKKGYIVKVSRSENLQNDLREYGVFADGVVAQIGFPCNRELINQLSECKVISISGVGFNHVDLEAAAQNNIAVVNVPDYCTEEVSDHTISLILTLTRRLFDYNKQVKNGAWDPLNTKPIHRFKNQTVGLLGFGRISKLVAKKLSQFGCTIIAHDRYVRSEDFEKYGVISVSLNELLRKSNVLSLHVPFTEETKYLINYDRLRVMPKGAIIINTCRGGVIKEEDLHKVIKEGHIAEAGLDVLFKEPPENFTELLSLDEVLITPHASYVSQESVIELRQRTSQNVIDVIEGKKLIHALT